MAFDSKHALNTAIKYLAETAHKRAAGGWVPPKERERQAKEQARTEEKKKREDEKQQKLLSKQFPTHYMPNVGRQVMADGGTPDDLNKVGLYSKAVRVASALPQKKAKGDQMIAALRDPKRGVKKEELINAGLMTHEGAVHPDWAGRSVTTDELADHLRGQMPQIEERVLGYKPTEYGHKTSDEWNEAVAQAELAGNWDEANRIQEAWEKSESAPTKYHSYTLPGSENYREVLLKYAESPEQKLERAKSLVDPAAWARMTDEQKQQFLSYPDKGIFKSQHWDDPNVLAHIRMADRTGPNGEKILHVEELQSDWGQKGKKEGFAIGSKEKAAAKAKMEEIEKQVAEQGHDANGQQQAEWMAAKAKLDDRGIPSAPYVTSTEGWTDLALKRVLKEAAEGGYDKVVWTPGAEQAKRYDLSNHIDQLEYHPESKDLIGMKNNQVIMNKSVEPEKIEDYVGKDVAKNLLAQPLEGQQFSVGGFHSLSGQDLSVGGEGMKGYYDKIVPSRLQALAKKHDPQAKIGTYRIPVQGNTTSADEIARELGMTVDQISKMPSDDKMSAIKSVQNTIGGQSLDVTPQMRESIMKGQEAYKRGGTVSKKHSALSIPGVHIREEEHGIPTFTGER